MRILRQAEAKSQNALQGNIQNHLDPFGTFKYSLSSLALIGLAWMCAVKTYNCDLQLGGSKQIAKDLPLAQAEVVYFRCQGAASLYGK